MGRPRQDDDAIEIFCAVENIRDYRLLPNPGETPEEFAQAEEALRKLLERLPSR